VKLPLPVRVEQRFGYVPMLVGSDWPAEGAIGHLNPARMNAEQIGAEVVEAINKGSRALALLRWITDTWGPCFDRYGPNDAPPVQDYGADFIEQADEFTRRARDILAGKAVAE
jgi:hypothetical protein